MIIFFRKNLDILIYFLCGIILIIGSYNCLLNINQARLLKKNIVVRDNDTNYNEYQANILIIENKLETIENPGIKKRFQNVVNLMKSGGAYYLFPYSKVLPMDLYELNSYFVDTLINDGWIANLRDLVIEDNKLYNDYISMMVKKYEYINKELLDNENYYQFKNSDARDVLQEEYDGILSNYCSYSKLMVELAKDLGDYYAESN